MLSFQIKNPHKNPLFDIICLLFKIAFEIALERIIKKSAVLLKTL